MTFFEAPVIHIGIFHYFTTVGLYIQQHQNQDTLNPKKPKPKPTMKWPSSNSMISPPSRHHPPKKKPTTPQKNSRETARWVFLPSHPRVPRLLVLWRRAPCPWPASTAWSPTSPPPCAPPKNRRRACCGRRIARTCPTSCRRRSEVSELRVFYCVGFLRVHWKMMGWICGIFFVFWKEVAGIVCLVGF